MCKEAKVLLVISALFTFAIGLSNIFVNVFFWKQTNDFIIIAVYNLMHYITIPMAFVMGGILAKRKNGIWSLRIGLLTYAMFYGLILLWGNRGTFYIYLLGAVYGIATGFYWLAFNTLSFDFTHLSNRDTFNGFNGCSAGVAAAVSPMASAYIISVTGGMKGYTVVFALTLAMFVILAVISLFLRCRNYGSRLDYRRAFSSNGEEWAIIRRSTAIWGFRDVTIVFLVNILIIEATKSEMSLGKLTLLGALLSSGSYVLVQKVIKPPARRFSILLGAVGSFMAVLIPAIKVEYATLLSYVALDAFFLPFFLIQLSSATFNVIERNQEKDMRIEYMINKDIVLNSGRVASILLFIAMLSVFDGTSIIKFYLLFIGLVPVASGYFLRKLRTVLEGNGKDAG